MAKKKAVIMAKQKAVKEYDVGGYLKIPVWLSVELSVKAKSEAEAIKQFKATWKKCEAKGEFKKFYFDYDAFEQSAHECSFADAEVRKLINVEVMEGIDDEEVAHD